MLQIIAIVVSLAIAAVGIALFARAISGIIGTIRIGQPALNRTDNVGSRVVTLVKETLGHTRMLQWTAVGIGHWFIFVGFGLLFFTLVTAFGQLFDAHFALPLVGHFFLFEWLIEFFSVVMIAAILAFIVYRLTRPKERTRGDKGRFFGSQMWQGYFVEFVILGVGLCIMALRGLEYALLQADGGQYADNATAFHFPFSAWLGELFSGLSVGTLENLIYLVAMLKILISFTWMIVISLNWSMGVAWHRFTVFFNIFFKRESGGGNALGAMKPLVSDGKPVTLDDIDDLDEDATLGVGKVEDFSWKGILDFTSCTECGRCQSQCPAWNTEKPLSPKLLIMGLRDHAYQKAPYVRAGGEGSDAATAVLEKDSDVADAVNRALIGKAHEGEWFYNPDGGDFVIDEDVLWSCTNCGACVQQCPVDIEHVDHIEDMRRYQLLVESNFPAELNQLFKGLDNKGNPWNMSPNARMDWAKDLDFEVKVVGETIESLEEVDWLFWVGCAGAYEDRAKKTTRAVAELLDTAGISFGVLGNGETCSGDPARRAGNEFLFQGLAQQNVETFKEYKVKKVVSTCAHCFNTLRNEYKEFGIELEVVHHTQLLNRLVREGKLTPVKEGEGAAKRSITYHDPCFLGRHNQVYSPPRELLQILPGAEYVEMERNSERSFCCGAGGARMWMEETIGERINVNRTQEAVGTGADQIAVGCPFCRVMLADGLTAEQAKGDAREEVEVLDVAQMLLASVKGVPATKAAPASAAPAAAKAGAAVSGAAATDVATKDEPEAGDVTVTENTVTETEDVGPNAKASGGSSLFDLGGDETPAPAATAAPASDGGGSLFDLGAPEEQVKDEPEAKPAAAPAPVETGSDLGSGGSLFDLGAPAEEPAKAESTPEPAAKPAESVDLGSGSLFDIAAPAEEPTSEQPTSEQPAAPAPTEKAETASEPTPAPTPEAATKPAGAAPPAESVDLSGSLFDIAAPAEQPKSEQPAAPESAPEAAPEPGPTVEREAPEAPDGASLSQAATAAAAGADEPDGATAAPTEQPAEEPAEQPTEEPTTEEKSEPEQKEQPAPPTSSGEKNQPRTDVDINESGSLFDL